MKKSSKKRTHSLFPLHRIWMNACVLLLSFFFFNQSHAQLPFVKADPYVMAHYPLDCEGDKIMRLYDISSRGQHGWFYNAGVKDLNSIFTADQFITGSSCISKTTGDECFIKIPNLYKKADFNKTPIMCSFWMYADTRQLNESGPATVLSMPAFSILRSITSEANMKITLIFSGQPSVIPAMDISLSPGPAWYFICFTCTTSPTNKGFLNVTGYSYTFLGNDISKYDPSYTAIQRTSSIAVSNPVVTADQDNESGTLFSGTFSGKLWNLRFYTDKMISDPYIINDYRNVDWYQSLGTTYADLGANWPYPVLSTPVCYYPCEGAGSSTSITDFQSGVKSVSMKDFSFVVDRFGKPGAALAFQPTGNVVLEPFFKAYTPLADYDLRKGYSISFWTNIDVSLYPPDDGSIPFTDEDARYQYIFLSSPSNGNMAGGLSRVRDRLVANRYIPLNPPRPWELWFWDPVSFQDQKGWYHVIFSQKENAMRVSMYKPNGDTACRLNYFNPQVFDPTIKMGFGNPLGNLLTRVQAANSIDDVRFYNWPLSQQEADWLHINESANINTKK